MFTSTAPVHSGVPARGQEGVEAAMEPANLGMCNVCKEAVPAEFHVRQGQVWIRKQCPQCGLTESLVSNDAATWQLKRDVWGYVPVDVQACKLDCDRCRIDHHPNLVFVDVTNRCNMNCPICIATIRDMGFDFNPPLAYFEKLFAHIERMDPIPMVELFGGEPTVRDDLLEIIAIGRRHGIRPRVVTNGLRLADEDYARTLCDARVRMRFAFDGRSADIYEQLRHNRPAYEKKVKALENLDRFSRRRHAFIACAARGINDRHMPDFLQYCHDHRDLISDLGIIPLAENWSGDEFDVQVRTTLEDVENMVKDAVPGGGVEFVPAGLSWCLRLPRSFFRKGTRSEVLLLAGVHPNCESMTLLISDGKCYRGLEHYLKRPFSQMAAEGAEIARKIEPKLSRLDRDRFFQRVRGQWLVLWSFGPWALRRLRVGRFLGHTVTGWFRDIFRRLRRDVRTTAARHRRSARVFRVAILPFEEYHSIDAARLEHCKAVFAYEDVDDGAIKTIPACTWYEFRNPILKRIAKKYGKEDKVDPPTSEPPASAGGRLSVRAGGGG